MSAILVVEDDPDIRETFKYILEIEGFEVVTAANGQEALETSRRLHPALIFLDLMMPIMNGWQFLERQKHDPELAGTPVFVVSAAGKHALFRDCSPTGFLSKPVEMESLLAVARRYCAPHPHP
jgi:CheY-like chemotaxis protein